MTGWQDARVTECQVDSMPGWRCDRVTLLPAQSPPWHSSNSASRAGKRSGVDSKLVVREFVEQNAHWAESLLSREFAEQIWAESSLSSRRERKAKQQLGKVSPLRTSLCVLLTLLNIYRCFFLLLNFFKLSKHLPVLQFQARLSLHNVIIWQRHWMQSQWNIH